MMMVMNSIMRILVALPIIGFMFMAILQVGEAKELFGPSPAPNGPANDGSAIDQGVAYVLLLLALALTYLIH